MQTGAMAVKIVIEGQGFHLEAELSNAKATKRVAEALPLRASMSRWGDEYYGRVNLQIPEDPTGKEIIEVGEIAYCPPGKALCIFFGPTPASRDQRPRATSAVLPVGRVTAGLATLQGLGPSVRISFREA